MEKRYTALRVIGTIYKVIGLLVGALTILSVLGICAASVLGGAAMEQLSQQFGDGSGGGLAGGLFGGLLLSLAALIYGGGLSVTLYAFGEGVYLFLAIEENTRATTELLRSQNRT
jgi:hypothetical protein